MLRIVVIVLVFVGAIFVLSTQKPEQVFGRSADGVVVFEGVSSRVRSVSIESFPTFDAALENRISAYYSFTPDLVGVTFSGSLTVQILEQWKQMVDDPTELVIYVYRSPVDGWQPLTTEIDLSKNTLHARLELSKPLWIAVGIRETLNVEN